MDLTIQQTQKHHLNRSKILKKELQKIGYDITSIKIGEKSTGFAFNSGTKYKTLTIKGKDSFKLNIENVYQMMVDLKFSSTLAQAKSYTILTS